MPDLQYRLRQYGGLWHWEVLGGLLGHGATRTREASTAEAMIYAAHLARHVEIDTMELARSAARAEIAHLTFAEAERKQQVARQRVDKLTLLHDRTVILLAASRLAAAEADTLLTSTQSKMTDGTFDRQCRLPDMPTPIPERFRFYAALCRAFANTTPFPQHRSPLLAQAKQWEIDADRAEKDSILIESSLILLARIDSELRRR